MKWIKAEVEDDLHRELKSKAAKRDLTITEAILQAIDRWVHGEYRITRTTTTGGKK